jgi:hypothetical protein
MFRSSVRTTSFLLLAFATLLPAAARGDQQCKPVVGSFEAQVVADGCESPVGLCTAGRVWGGIQGNYEFTMTSFAPTPEAGEVPTIFFFTGRSTVLLKSGDTVLGIDTGSIDVGAGGFASLITFKGGTGAAATASGQIRLRGELDQLAGTTSGDYIGTICTSAP